MDGHPKLSGSMNSWYKVLKEQLTTYNMNPFEEMVGQAIGKGRVLLPAERERIWLFIANTENKESVEQLSGSDCPLTTDKILEYKFHMALFAMDAPLMHRLCKTDANAVTKIMTRCLQRDTELTTSESKKLKGFFEKNAKKEKRQKSPPAVSALTEMMNYKHADRSRFVPQEVVAPMDQPFRYRKMQRMLHSKSTLPEEITFKIGAGVYHGTLWAKSDQDFTGTEEDVLFLGRIYFEVIVVDDGGDALEVVDAEGGTVFLTVQAFYEGDVHRADNQPFGVESLWVLADHGAWRELVRG